MGKRVVIHRDRTFEFEGETYTCMRQGPYGGGDSVWEIWRTRDGKSVGDEFDSLADVRRYVNESQENGWPLIEDEGD